jgi:hypothetical protein
MSDLTQVLRGAKNELPLPDKYLDQLLEDAAARIDELEELLRQANEQIERQARVIRERQAEVRRLYDLLREHGKSVETAAQAENQQSNQ